MGIIAAKCLSMERLVGQWAVAEECGLLGTHGVIAAGGRSGLDLHCCGFMLA